MEIRLLTAHPESVGETYFEHMVFAARFGGCMILGGLACLVHAVLPFLLTSAGSRRVRHLHGLVVCRPVRQRVVAEEFNWSI